jgi:hypothetical protein
MALMWDPAPVAEISPPLTPELAERALKRVFRRLANEAYEERTETQNTRQVTAELTQLRKALDGLSPRAQHLLREAFANDAARQDLIAIRYPTDHPTFPSRPLSGWVVMRVMHKAVERALHPIPRQPRGNPGLISAANRRAALSLCRIYCKAHRVPMPSYDFFHEETRNPEASDFAFDCLEAWQSIAVDEDRRPSVIRSLLHKNSV